MSSELKSIPLQKFLTQIKQKGYTATKVYAQGPEVKFIQLYSSLQRKPFLLQVPNRFVIYSTETDHMLERIENDYRTFRQREYLEKIQLRDVACMSKNNLCVKNNTIYMCYIIDNLFSAELSDADDLEDLPTEDDVQEFPSPEFQEDYVPSDAESDIEVDDYPVEDIYPVFNMMSFIKQMDDFEETVLEHYTIITEAEEQMNEDEVTKLLSTFDRQKKILKDRIFSSHRDAYNIRRDLSRAGQNLQRIYTLKDKSTDERDRVRFKIERMAVETEEHIDGLNGKLREYRNQADMLLKKYWQYIDKFDLIE